MMKPGVGILFNGSLGRLLAECRDAVDFVSVIPERFWNDLGRGASPRFVPLPDEVATLEGLASSFPLVAHGIGLSIGSGSTFDIEHVNNLATWHRRYGFGWISEHLAAVRVVTETTLDHHAGLALPLPWDEDVLDLLCCRVMRAQDTLGTQLILENGVVHTPVPDTDMTEAEFLNALCARTGCGVLLDVHNVHVNAVNLGIDAKQFIDSVNLDNVREIHIAGGNELYGVYLDSHAGPCPDEVWNLLDYAAPRCRNLNGVTFEFHESYYPKLREAGILAELQRARSIVQDNQGKTVCHSQNSNVPLPT
jgi:uncharacterized protein